MRHPRFIVYTGAIGALAVMTVLSVVFGWMLPLLMPGARAPRPAPCAVRLARARNLARCVDVSLSRADRRPPSFAVKYTHYLSVLLFAYFGFVLLKEVR